jgi:hypothetical protein
MYGYEETIDISPEQLLQKVSQEKIFELVLEQPFSFNIRYKSPFREHSKNIGTCRFERRDDGTILFVDFGDLRGRTHRSCFRMVMDKFSVNLTTSMKIIAQAFNLPLDKSAYNEVTVLVDNNEYSYHKRDHQDQDSDTKDTEIFYTAKEYNRDDRLHWSKFLIKIEELLEDQVYSLRNFTVINDKGRRTFTAYKHCYAIDFLDAVKIYQPYSKEYKWITNCTENHIGNIDNLPASADELIIQKSYKDHRVLRNLKLDLNVCWFSSEGVIPSIEILQNLLLRFKLITVFYDNDAAGIAAALRLVTIFNSLREGSARMVHLPCLVQRKITYKNTSDFIHREGRGDLIEVLKHIQLIK